MPNNFVFAHHSLQSAFLQITPFTTFEFDAFNGLIEVFVNCFADPGAVSRLLVDSGAVLLYASRLDQLSLNHRLPTLPFVLLRTTHHTTLISTLSFFTLSFSILLIILSFTLPLQPSHLLFLTPPFNSSLLSLPTMDPEQTQHPNHLLQSHHLASAPSSAAIPTGVAPLID